MLSFESAACACVSCEHLHSRLRDERRTTLQAHGFYLRNCHANIHVTIMYVALVKRAYTGPDLQVPGCDVLYVRL